MSSKYTIEHPITRSRISLKGWANGAAMEIVVVQASDVYPDTLASITLNRDELDVIHNIIENFLSEPEAVWYAFNEEDLKGSAAND